MSKLIVIEGPDGVGKATQTSMLVDYINNVLGLKAVRVEVPIDDALTYPVIYWMLRNGLAKKFPKSFQWLQVLNRRIFQSTKLVSLEHDYDYDYVVFDRWHTSTAVYGAAEGLSGEFLSRVGRLLRLPDFTIVLVGKSHRPVAEDVYESDDDLQVRVRRLYEAWSGANPRVSCVVDASPPRADVAATIRSVLRERRMIPS